MISDDYSYVILEYNKSHIIDLLDKKIQYYKMEEKKRLNQEKMMEEYIEMWIPSLTSFWTSKRKIKKIRESLKESFYTGKIIYKPTWVQHKPIRYRCSYDHLIEITNKQKIAPRPWR